MIPGTQEQLNSHARQINKNTEVLQSVVSSLETISTRLESIRKGVNKGNSPKSPIVWAVGLNALITGLGSIDWVAASKTFDNVGNILRIVGTMHGGLHR